MTEKIQDTTWIETQDVKFIENLKQLVEGFNIAIRQNNLMVQLFNEYGMALHSILNAAIATENDNISNTNFSETGESGEAVGGNRAERRAQEKKDKKNPPQGKKLPFDKLAEKAHDVGASNTGKPKQN